MARMAVQEARKQDDLSDDLEVEIADRPGQMPGGSWPVGARERVGDREAARVKSGIVRFLISVSYPIFHAAPRTSRSVDG